MEEIAITIPGTVGEIPIRLRLSKSSKTILFIAHGMGGSLESSLPRFLALDDQMMVNTIRFTTSRYPSDQRVTDYASMQDVFRDKVYEQELEDVRRVIVHVLKNSEKIFQASPSSLNIFLLGTSMGGISAATLSGEFPVKGVLIVNSGAWFRGAEHLPRLIEGFPNIDRVKNILGKLNAPVVVFRGERDPIVTRDAAQALAAMAKNGTFIEVTGLAHSMTDPQSMPEAREKMLSQIRTFIREP